MKFDEYGLLISEEHDDSTENGFQGNRGESLATTARYMQIKNVLYGEYDPVALLRLRTSMGYIRHIDSKWGFKDESSDQLLPVVCFNKSFGPIQTGIKIIDVDTLERLKHFKWRTGNGDLVSVKLYALLTEKTWLLNASLVIQRLIFLFPWRYNEEKFNQKKWPIESSYNSSADWINVIHLLYYASPWVRRLYSKNRLKERVRHYYKNEPNVAWFIEMYDRFIERL